MELEELQKTWDQQDINSLNVIDKTELDALIYSQKTKTGKTTGYSEVFLIASNSFASAILIFISFNKGNGNIFSYALAVLMLSTAVYIFAGRQKRRRSENLFDTSVYGDLLLALSNATFQVHLSQIMRWYVLPVGVLTILAMWNNESSLFSLLLIFLFFGITWFAGKWEHQMYVKKKQTLEELTNQLTDLRNN